MINRSVLERAQRYLAQTKSEPNSRSESRPDETGKKRTKEMAHPQPQGSGLQHPERHHRRCKICHHPDLDAIEQDFLRWRSTYNIARDYGITDRSSIYRHAHATGLYGRRSANIRWALEPIIEEADSVAVTASAVVRAICAYAHINEVGEWVEPPRTHIISRVISDAERLEVLETPAASLQTPDPDRMERSELSEPSEFVEQAHLPAPSDAASPVVMRQSSQSHLQNPNRNKVEIEYVPSR